MLWLPTVSRSGCARLVADPLPTEATDRMAEEPWLHGIKIVDLTGELTDQTAIAKRAWRLMATSDDPETCLRDSDPS